MTTRRGKTPTRTTATEETPQATSPSLAEELALLDFVATHQPQLAWKVGALRAAGFYTLADIRTAPPDVAAVPEIGPILMDVFTTELTGFDGREYAEPACEDRHNE